jgi:hypothetical protein
VQTPISCTRNTNCWPPSAEGQTGRRSQSGITRNQSSSSWRTVYHTEGLRGRTAATRGTDSTARNTRSVSVGAPPGANGGRADPAVRPVASARLNPTTTSRAPPPRCHPIRWIHLGPGPGELNARTAGGRVWTARRTRAMSCSSHPSIGSRHPTGPVSGRRSQTKDATAARPSPPTTARGI